MSDLDRLFDVPEPVTEIRVQKSRKIYTTTLRGVTIVMETRQQADNAARGLHPTSGFPLAEIGTCGDCGLLLRHERYRHTYLKCLAVPDLTHGPGTDVRAKWPACTRFATSVDAAPGMLISELLDDTEQAAAGLT